jgi:anaerobic ribonucleoside-triphosphate reductase activating protein
MNISGIIWDAVNIYDGVAVEIYISGCNHNCPGCHNPEMQDFNYGKPLDIIELIDILNKQQDWFDIISILGGDLLCQPEEKSKILLRTIVDIFPDKKLWLFTGKDFEEVPQWCFSIFDVIKTGRYMQNLEPGDKLSSWNQKFWYKGKDY